MTQHGKHNEHNDHREITIETLATPPVRISPAPMTKRVAAGVVDSLLLALLWIVLTLAAGQNLSVPSMVSLNQAPIAYLAVLVFAYYFVLEGVFAATIGKSLLKLRVFGKDGESCSLGAAFKRNLLRFVDWLPFLYIFAAIAIMTSPSRQRIGDRIAATIVSSAPEKDINPPPAPFLFH